MKSSFQAACLFIVALIVSVANAQIPAPGIPDSIGVNIHFTHAKPGEMKMLADAGFKWVRMDFNWEEIEKKPGEYDWSDYDHLLADCDQYHIHALLILDYSNKHYDDGQSPHSDEAVAAFAKWAAAAVTHFKGRGVLWEMYNEPNGFWRPKPDVQAYVKLALATGEAVKTARPNELYIGPALAGLDPKWIDPCLQAGLLKYWDAVSFHPYGQTIPEDRAKGYANLRAKIEKYKPAGKTIPIIAGEWGYSDIWANLGKDNQAKIFAREMLFNLSEQIPLTIWYDWHDDGTTPTEQEHHFGLTAYEYHKDRDPVYDPKPAYQAAQTLMRFGVAGAFTKRLKLDRDDDFVLQFGDDEAVTYAAWSTDGKPHKATLPIFSGHFGVESMLGKPEDVVTADEKGLTITITDSPQYLAHSVQ